MKIHIVVPTGTYWWFVPKYKKIHNEELIKLYSVSTCKSKLVHLLDSVVPFCSTQTTIVVEELIALSWAGQTSKTLVPSAHDVDFLLASVVLNCDLRSTHTTMSLNELRLSIFLLPEAGQTFQDPPAYDGDCILHSQFQGTQWRNPFQVL